MDSRALEGAIQSLQLQGRLGLEEKGGSAVGRIVQWDSPTRRVCWYDSLGRWVGPMFPEYGKCRGVPLKTEFVPFG